jgi:hypothetical protein
LLIDQISRKFTEVIDVNDYLVFTDTGWHPIIDVKQTIKYKVYILELVDGRILKCADDHIVFDQNMQEIFVKNLKTGDLIQTLTGLVAVYEVTETEEYEHMYDIGVNSEDHRFYTNEILSHNTTTAVGYLLWYGMFVENATILVAAHKFIGAQEIMQRIRYAYEMCPDHIRAGVIDYNKQSITFDNGSRIVAQTTTETTGRGMSISLLFCLDGDTTKVKIRDKETLVEEEILLSELYARMIIERSQTG